MNEKKRKRLIHKIAVEIVSRHKIETAELAGGKKSLKRQYCGKIYELIVSVTKNGDDEITIDDVVEEMVKILQIDLDHEIGQNSKGG